MLTLTIVYSQQLYPAVIQFENELNKTKLQAVQVTYHPAGILKCTINVNNEVGYRTIDSLASKLFGKDYLSIQFQ